MLDFSHHPWFSASTDDLSTLAVPVDRIREAAKHDRGITCAYERLVLGSVGALSRLKTADPKAEWDRCTLIGVVVCTLGMECTKAHLESMFVVPASLESASKGGK